MGKATKQAMATRESKFRSSKNVIWKTEAPKTLRIPISFVL